MSCICLIIATNIGLWVWISHDRDGVSCGVSYDLDHAMDNVVAEFGDIHLLTVAEVEDCNFFFDTLSTEGSISLPGLERAFVDEVLVSLSRSTDGAIPLNREDVSAHLNTVILVKIARHFDEWDRNFDGNITRDELQSSCHYSGPYEVGHFRLLIDATANELMQHRYEEINASRHNSTGEHDSTLGDGAQNHGRRLGYITDDLFPVGTDRSTAFLLQSAEHPELCVHVHNGYARTSGHWLVWHYCSEHSQGTGRYAWFFTQEGSYMTITNQEASWMHVHPDGGWAWWGVPLLVWHTRPRHRRIYLQLTHSEVKDEFYLRSHPVWNTHFYVHSHRGHAHVNNHLVFWPCGPACGRRIRFKLMPLWTFRPLWVPLGSVTNGFYGTQFQACEGTETTVEVTTAVSKTFGASVAGSFAYGGARIGVEGSYSVTRSLQYRSAFTSTRQECVLRSFAPTENGNGTWLWRFTLVFTSQDRNTEASTETGAYAQTRGAFESPLCWGGYCLEDCPHYQQCAEGHALPQEGGQVSSNPPHLP